MRLEVAPRVWPMVDGGAATGGAVATEGEEFPGVQERTAPAREEASGAIAAGAWPSVWAVREPSVTARLGVRGGEAGTRGATGTRGAVSGLRAIRTGAGLPDSM